MITLKEFWESKEKLVIHCDTEEKAKKLLCAFDRMGKKWCNGDSYVTTNNCWEDYKKDTCYTNRGEYGNIQFYKDHNIKVYEFEEIDDFHFKVGDRVRIRQWQDMVNEYGLDENTPIAELVKEFIKLNEIYTISKINNETVEFKEFDYSYIITTNMLEKVYDEKKKVKKEVDLFKEVKSLTNYSFRFNEERKSVTLYKNGKKVQFVKPQPDDKFNWKTGLGVCLYKQLYKGNEEVEYVKTIVNEKTFYSYCIAIFFCFDKSKVDTLEEHVRNCKRKYCEFQLSNI